MDLLNVLTAALPAGRSDLKGLGEGTGKPVAGDEAAETAAGLAGSVLSFPSLLVAEHTGQAADPAPADAPGTAAPTQGGWAAAMTALLTDAGDAAPIVATAPGTTEPTADAAVVEAPAATGTATGQPGLSVLTAAQMALAARGLGLGIDLAGADASGGAEQRALVKAFLGSLQRDAGGARPVGAETPAVPATGRPAAAAPAPVALAGGRTPAAPAAVPVVAAESVPGPETPAVAAAAAPEGVVVLSSVAAAAAPPPNRPERTPEAAPPAETRPEAAAETSTAQAVTDLAAATAAATATDAGSALSQRLTLGKVAAQAAQGQAARGAGPDAGAIRQQVFQQVMGGLTGRPGSEQITLLLNPEHLGEVQIELVVRNNDLSVTLTASNPEAEHALREGARELAEAISGRTLRWEQVEVRVEQRAAEQERSGQRQDGRRERSGQDGRDRDGQDPADHGSGQERSGADADPQQEGN